MNPPAALSRRQVLQTSAILLTGAALAAANSAFAAQTAAASKPLRIGVISATNRGKPQPRNGHTWHFAQYFYPTIDLDAICKFVDPGSAEFFRKYVRHPRYTFDQLPFPDTKITHYYDANAKDAADFAKAFPGVQVAPSVAELVDQVDAVWLGDASGCGDDHFDLFAPGLRKGLPIFCDKPSARRPPARARFWSSPGNAKRRSCPRAFSGTSGARRRRCGCATPASSGPSSISSPSLQSGYSDNAWMVYGQHPAWMVMTLMGAGVEAVSLYARGNAGHARVTFADRQPADIWYGRPNTPFIYNHTEVHFQKRKFEWSPAIEGDFWYGHHYEMFRMAATFREMVKTRREPVPHQEILEVTAMIHAGAKSRGEQSRLVKLAPHAPTTQYHHNRTGEHNADAHLKRQVMGREGRGLALPFSTFQRWRRRLHRGLPLLQSPGPKKTGPLPLAQLQPELAALPHRLYRTRGTRQLYRRHQSSLSRRKLNALAHAERARQKRQRRLAWQRLTWLSPNTAWAIDATEHVADQSGRKLYLVAIQDLASGLRFAPLVTAQLHGPTIAEHLRQLFAQQGAPLFLKRDNGSVFNDHAMESLLAHACVLPLNSPNACPRYNGAIEKGIRDMKASLLPCLPAPRHWQPDHVAPYIRAVLHLENSKPRRRLAGQSAVTTFFQRPRLRLSRRQRHLNFAWIIARADPQCLKP